MAALVAGSALIAGPTATPAAAAVVIENAITAVTVVPADPEPGESVKLNLEWAVPDSAVAGDTFSLALPGELKRITTAFPLMDGSDVVAYAVVENGRVTFTLTDFVNDKTGVHGTAFFWAQVSTDVKPGQTITIRYGTETTVVTVRDPGEPGTDPGFIDRTRPDKAGFWGDPSTGEWDVEGDYLYYYVLSPVAPSGGFSQVVVDDDLGPGQEYICGGDGVPAPEVRLFEIDPDTGDYADGVEYPQSQIECSVDRLRAMVQNVPENWLVAVEYWVRITDPDLDSYGNSASVTTDQTSQDTSTTIVRTGAGGTGTGTGTGNEATVTVTKSAAPASGTVLVPGQTVTYTLAFHHTGTGAATVDFTDFLDDVLDDATFEAVVDKGNLTVSDPAGGVMRITGLISADTTVTYTVKVKATDRGDNVLRNFVSDKPTKPENPDTQHPVRYLYVEKVGDGAGRLDGAEFVLRADNGGVPGAVLTTPTLTRVAPGLFVTGGIDAGTYWLEETKAPEGFQLLATAVRFKVADDGTVTLLNATDDEPQIAVSDADDGMSTVTVTDRRAFAVPLTGGAGASVFWISGGLLLAAAGYLVVRRRTPGTSRNQVREACM